MLFCMKLLNSELRNYGIYESMSSMSSRKQPENDKQSRIKSIDQQNCKIQPKITSLNEKQSFMDTQE